MRKLILQAKYDKYPQGTNMSYVFLNQAIKKLEDLGKRITDKETLTTTDREIFFIINGLSPLLSIFEDIKQPSQFVIETYEVEVYKGGT